MWWASREEGAFVREVLRRYVAVDAAALELHHGEHGKPYLPDHPWLHFSVSHSGGLVAVGVSLDEIGIDIERVRDRARLGAVTQRFLAQSEADGITRLAPGQTTEAFHRVWTAKEAYVKALGTGLHTPLHSFELDVETLTPVGGSRDGLSVAAIEAPPGYAAAVAVRGRLREIRVLGSDEPSAG